MSAGIGEDAYVGAWEDLGAGSSLEEGGCHGDRPRSASGGQTRPAGETLSCLARTRRADAGRCPARS